MTNIERIFMACAAHDENAEQNGPFTTAAGAESAARGLGWDWVLVYTHTMNSGKVTNVEKRFYQPFRSQIGTNPCSEITPQTGRMPLSYRTGQSSSSSSSSEDLKRRLSTPDVKPMSDEEITFFARYERQMR